MNTRLLTEDIPITIEDKIDDSESKPDIKFGANNGEGGEIIENKVSELMKNELPRIPHDGKKLIKFKEYKCDKCDFVCTQLCSWKSHLKRSHNFDTNKCPFCDYSSSRNLKAHVMSVHTKEKFHKCPDCDYSSTRLDNLRRHISCMHIQTKFYNCQHCPYKSTSEWNLKEHLNMKHEKSVVYSCHLCDYKGYRAQHLKFHINSIHEKNYLYFCEKCDYKATRSHHLKGHLKTRHKLC